MSVFLTSTVRDPHRLVSVCSESYGWAVATNPLNFPDAKNYTLYPRVDAFDYSIIAKKIRDIAAIKCGVYPFDAKLAKQEVLAVYDLSGNLQAVATYTIHPTALKIHKLVTAFWNIAVTKETSEKKLHAEKGAGTAAMAALAKIAQEHFGEKGFLYVEPSSSAKSFYERLDFVVVEGHTPAEEGCVCGMKLQLAEVAVGKVFAAASKHHDLRAVSEDSLPKTQLHFPKVFFSHAQDKLRLAK